MSLGDIIRNTALVYERTLSELTVMSDGRDPYRLDTPANHRNGRWFADLMAHHQQPTIHLRNLHYVAVTLAVTKPNGQRYVNDYANWTWLKDKASKAGRWLGYVPFTAIHDERSGDPVRFSQSRPAQSDAVVYTPGFDVGLPMVSDLLPRVSLVVTTRQPYRLAAFAEKSSVGPVIHGEAQWAGVDLFIGSGDTSDTWMFEMASGDDRPLVVFTFSDCDPSGWQMPVVIGRKLQALADGLLPDLTFKVIPVALMPDQVHSMRLPSSPLKAEEQRADRWRETFGTEQTEIDALATLDPRRLRTMAADAFDPFVDSTLERRTRDAVNEWQREAQRVLNEALGEQNHQAIADQIEQVRQALNALAHMQVRAGDIDVNFGEFVPPAPVIDDARRPTPFVHSGLDYVAITEALQARRDYR